MTMTGEEFFLALPLASTEWMFIINKKKDVTPAIVKHDDVQRMIPGS